VAIPSFDDLPRYVRDLQELLRIPSVSSDPSHRGHMRTAAEWLAGRLSWANGRVVETDGHPVVLAEWLGLPAAPTILVYAHYDVQNPGDETAWETPPFEPSVRDGLIYARGATDDKGPLLVPLLVAEAYLEQEGSLPLNVRFLLEGEEEIGSPSLPQLLRARREELDADLVVSADGAMWRASEPSLGIAAKGLVVLDVTVTGPVHDLHSGRHGGGVHNPLHGLASILATLHDVDGRVVVEGFYDDVVPPSAAEREALARIDFDESSYLVETGAPSLHGEPGYSTLERLWLRPTLDVNGVWGGGRRTVIPSIATARLSCRLVPDQRPEQIAQLVERHVRAHCPASLTVLVEREAGGTPAYALRPDHPAVEAAVASLHSVYPNEEPLLVRIGGTLPAATMFEELLGVKTILFSFSTSDEQLHAPNEFFRLERLEKGLAAWADLWSRLAAIGGRDLRVR
jgi:acetylornithine deacetylase/succinyl-diaminopimelate desuccinylase-like protein